MGLDLSLLFASILAGAAPIVFASVGETITEKAGVINLSLDGSILLGAMVAFVTAYRTGSLVAGFLAGAVAGGAVAALLGVFSVYLGQSQVAVGFVLTLTARDLAYFFGNPYSRLYGPQAGPSPIPGLQDIPFFGPFLFSQSVPVYLSLLAIGLAWWYLYRTPMGLGLRAVGENPGAAYARGFSPRKTQMLYTVLGGLLVGLAGATFALCTKPGWGRPQGAEGTGWIALAIVIFGGWHPVRAALGAYLFSFLQVVGIHLQGVFPSIPAQVFQVAPFPLMIFTLVLSNTAGRKTRDVSPVSRSPLARFLGIFTGAPPASLGRPFHPE
ncbi:MAG: ABC transporter permease [Desulfobacteraceae bacterium]|jgi:simple sugar transport system permease protein